MGLSDAQRDRFERDGFLVLPELFSKDEVAVLRAPLAALFAADDPANIVEKHSGEVRTAMGLHLRDSTFAKLVRHPRLIEPALQIMGEAAYIQQVKVNVKPAFVGEAWQWHYDFATHHAEDGVAAPRALNLHVFLDDVTELNGPLYVIPGSQRHGALPARLDIESTSYPLWVVDRERVGALAAEAGLAAATGPAGTALIFGDLLVHASPGNISPYDRRIFSLILNPVSNAQTSQARPDHKHHRDFSPVAQLADDCLLAPVPA